MNAMRETVLTVCVVLIAIELFARLVPKTAMLNYVRGLIAVILLLSAVSTISGLDIRLPTAGELAADENSALNEYLSQNYEETVKRQAKNYLTGLLETIEVAPREIQIFTDKNTDGSIIITKIQIVAAYEVDRTRALALLKNVVGKETELEVKLHGT